MPDCNAKLKQKLVLNHFEVVKVNKIADNFENAEYIRVTAWNIILALQFTLKFGVQQFVNFYCIILKIYSYSNLFIYGQVTHEPTRCIYKN